jgi:hypothetical protein
MVLVHHSATHPRCLFSLIIIIMGPLRGLLAAAAPSIAAAAAPLCCRGLAFSASATASDGNNVGRRLRRRPLPAEQWGNVAPSCRGGWSVVAGAYTVEWNDDDNPPDDASPNKGRFSARTFASSDCWGRRPFLVRGAFDPNLLSGRRAVVDGEDAGGGGVSAGPATPAAAWPSWEEVVEIASDVDSESR